MSAISRKIINDPVYGFLTVDHPLILKVINHPYYQRLRRIHQMAFAHLVFPGAVHSRLHHSLGAYHLMCNALSELKSKGVSITQEEELATKCAILLHDCGHGPYSHALENVLIRGIHHEAISLLIMEALNGELNGQLDLAIQIFNNNYHKPFLYQLISGQLDVDRMDYLTRDSFFTGVSEGTIGYDRILKMLTVQNGELMVEEKGIYSTEKFLVARRLMYWQVYLHKTVLSAEKMLVKIIERAQELRAAGVSAQASTETLDFFLGISNTGEIIADNLGKFCLLDDYDVMSTIKNWMFHPDRVLSLLCQALVERKLFKTKIQSEEFDSSKIEEMRNRICEELQISREESRYFIFTGVETNTTYDPAEERINILFKDGTVRDISEVVNALIQDKLAEPVKKNYICHYRIN